MTDTNGDAAPSFADHFARAVAAHPKPAVLWTPDPELHDDTDYPRRPYALQSGHNVANADFRIYRVDFHLTLALSVRADGDGFVQDWSAYRWDPDRGTHGDVEGDGNRRSDPTLAGILEIVDQWLDREIARIHLDAAIDTYSEALLERAGLIAPEPAPAPEPGPPEPVGPSEDAGLASLTVGPSRADVSARGTLDPAFDRNTLDYTIRGSGLIRIEAATSDENATVEWHLPDGTVDRDAAIHRSVPANGLENVTLIVIAEDGITKRTYLLTIRPE